MPKPNQLAKIVPRSGDAQFNQHYQQLTDTVNTLMGANGRIQLHDGLDLGGKTVANIGTPQGPSDALASSIAESRYSPGVVAQQLKPGAAHSMVGYRQLNSTSQREGSSSFLNDLMSTAPSANAIYPTLTNVDGGVKSSIPAGPFTSADGSTVMLIARQDLLPFPAQFEIASISSSGNLVSVQTSTPSGLSAGQVATISGVTPSGFNGTVLLTSATPPYGLTYQADLGASTGMGGSVQENGVWYFSVKKRSQYIVLTGPFLADTSANRLQVNFDGSQIVAVVVVTANGGQVAQSGGGGSPIVGSPTSGSFF